MQPGEALGPHLPKLSEGRWRNGAPLCAPPTPSWKQGRLVGRRGDSETAPQNGES